MFKRASAVVLSSCLLFLLASCTFYAKPKKGFAGATGGEQLESQFWNDIKSKNWKDLEPRIAPMFSSTGPGGTRDRAASVEHWKTFHLESASLGDVQVHSAGADYVVTATVTLAGTVGGQPVPSQPMHTMSVWQQVSKGFVMVAHSDSLP